jgi:DNA primase
MSKVSLNNPNLESMLSQVLEANPIEEVAAEYLTLEVCSPGVSRACCKHGEKTPSLYFYSNTQKFHCYGCQTHGNVLDFVRWMDDSNWYDTLAKLCTRAGIDIPKGQLSEEDKANAALYDRTLEESRGYARALRRDAASKAFFADKGMTDDDLVTWRLGSHYGKPVYSILDERGRTCGFGFRKGADPKYYNSDGSAIFKKGNILYGLYQGLALVRQEKYLVLVEGYNDAIILQKHGVPAVALMGTAMTDNQVKLVKRYASTAILFLDGDEAGIGNTLRHAIRLVSSGLQARVINLAGRDPDDLARELKDQTGSFIKLHSQEAISYVLGHYTQVFQETVLNASLALMSEFATIEQELQDQAMTAYMRKKLEEILYAGPVNRNLSANAAQQGPLREDSGPCQQGSCTLHLQPDSGAASRRTAG